LGFALLGVSHRSAYHGLRRSSSCVLSDPADGGHPSRTHLRVSIADRLPRPVAGPRPLLGFRTFPNPNVQVIRNPGYVFTSPATRHYWRFDRILGLPRLCRSRPDWLSVPDESFFRPQGSAPRDVKCPSSPAVAEHAAHASPCMFSRLERDVCCGLLLFCCPK
jgi:hypothetical protein